MRVEMQEVFYKEKSRYIYFFEKMYYISLLGYNIFKSTLFLKVLLIL